MKPRKALPICLAVWAAAAGVCRGQYPTSDERALWQLWTRHASNVTEHAAMAAACREFSVKAPQSPFLAVAQGLEGWHLLKAGRTQEAVQRFEAMLPTPPKPTALQLAGADMARGWLTRLDREKVRQALKTLYLRDIEFPKTLDPVKALKAAERPVLTDRWGQPWEYRLKGTIKGLETQQYVLESTHLGPASDLGSELQVPYASRINLQPLGVSPGSAEIYEFSSPARKSILLQEGRQMDGITVACIGTGLIVMTDGSHWRVTAKPR